MLSKNFNQNSTCKSMWFMKRNIKTGISICMLLYMIFLNKHYLCFQIKINSLINKNNHSFYFLFFIKIIILFIKKLFENFNTFNNKLFIYSFFSSKILICWHKKIIYSLLISIIWGIISVILFLINSNILLKYLLFLNFDEKLFILS